MHEVVVGGDDFRLVLRVGGYEFPGTESGSDANWLTGEAAMTLDNGSSFAARRAVSFRTDELASFRDEVTQLVEDLSGEAVFQHLEDEVGCIIRLQQGRGELQGFVGEHVPHVRLSVERVPTDQSYLRETARQLNALMSALPVRGDPFG
jgi:hypothetical protein